MPNLKIEASEEPLYVCMNFKQNLAQKYTEPLILFCYKLGKYSHLLLWSKGTVVLWMLSKRSDFLFSSLGWFWRWPWGESLCVKWHSERWAGLIVYPEAPWECFHDSELICLLKLLSLFNKKLRSARSHALSLLFVESKQLERSVSKSSVCFKIPDISLGWKYPVF